MATKDICTVEQIDNSTDITNIIIDESGNLRKVNLKKAVNNFTPPQEKIEQIQQNTNDIAWIRGDISDLKTQVSSLSEENTELKSDIDNLEIENYDHVHWNSILNKATITGNRYAEKSGDTIVITSNSSYKIYEYDLTGISKVKMNVLNFFDIKLFFLDNNNKIIAYYPSERVTTPTMTEVITDVPSGATKIVTSITNDNVDKLYAYKYENMYNMTDEMRNKMSSISYFEKLEIEGYQKENYIDCIDKAELHNGMLCEMVNGKMNFGSHSNYKYYVIDVEKGQKFKTTGLYGWDIRPAMYADDNDNVIDYYPIERVTSPNIITAETTAPEGATRLYVCAYTSTEVEIKTGTVYYAKIKSELDKQITVNINTNETLDTTIITEVGNLFRQKAEVLNNIDQPNSAILPRSCEVYLNGAWKTIVNNEDDNCPVNLASGYIGAGHGYDRAYKLTLENHGKTYADIGSEWKDTDNYSWYIVRIIDENNFVIIGQNSTNNNYDTLLSNNTGILTHVSGAVNTDSVSGYTRAIYLITPIDKNHVKKIMLDGISEVSENGTYKANNYVDLIDEYDIINPQTIVSEIQQKKPSGGYTENPPINTGDTFLHMSNVYRYLNDGTLLIFTTLDNDTNVSISYWGATQYAQKSNKAEFGGKLFRYVPKLLPVNGYDIRTPFNMANWNFTINATTETWEDSNNPPDRLLHLFTDSNDKYVVGYAVGYLPLGLGEPSIRKNNVSNAMFLYQTQKMYPHLIDNGGTNGGNWAEYTPLQSVCYRKPVLDVSNIHTDAYFIPYGEKCYMYIDYHAVCDDRIKVPSEYVGKPMRVLEKSENVTVYGTITTDEVRVRVSTSSPMYGYAVAEIG